MATFNGEYYRSGEQKGYRPLAQATDEMERRLLYLNVEGKALLIAVTHDINVASFLAGRCAVSSFTDVTWPQYLDAAVIMDDGYGAREYGWLRNEEKASEVSKNERTKGNDAPCSTVASAIRSCALSPVYATIGE